MSICERRLMKTMINIPMDLYRTLLPRCDRDSSEYENMVNGVIEGDHLRIQCDGQSATNLVSWAEKCFPGASKKIEVVRQI
jgi:hypothetical protein